MNENRSRRGLLVAIAFVPILLAGFLWLPRYWEEREYRQIEGIAGVEAKISPGKLADARDRVKEGMKIEAVAAAIGKPALSVATDGISRHEIWRYYYADGTLLLNVTDGLVQRVSADFHPPVIPTSARPR
ncbi:MAG TPA: hypothetical protein VH854_10020 [Thermoanaerobaculia bacterium]|jgi:hypothetical protein|nr:hypothetical protein [Thermoanaerobaculia bacterium]